MNMTGREENLAALLYIQNLKFRPGAISGKHPEPDSAFSRVPIE
jgi:hypothetical protein